MKFEDLEICKRFIHPEKKKILTYVGLLYSVESPLNGIQNLQERKLEACKQAKLDPKHIDVISIMELKHKQVNDIIFVYLSEYQHHNAYQQLCQDQQLFWNISQLLMKPLEVDDEDSLTSKYSNRMKLSEQADGLVKRIRRLYAEIYREEETQEMAETHVRQMLRPEQRVKMREAS